MRRILSQRSWFRILDRLLTSVVHSSPLADCNYLIAVGWLPPEAVFSSSMTSLALCPLDSNQWTPSSPENKTTAVECDSDATSRYIPLITQLRNILQICSSPAGFLQSIAPHRNPRLQTLAGNGGAGDEQSQGSPSVCIANKLSHVGGKWMPFVETN